MGTNPQPCGAHPARTAADDENTVFMLSHTCIPPLPAIAQPGFDGASTPGGALAKLRQWIGNFAALALAGLLAACAIDDSGPVRSVWRPANGKPSYINVVYLTDREPDPSAAAGFGQHWADEASCGVARPSFRPPCCRERSRNTAMSPRPPSRLRHGQRRAGGSGGRHRSPSQGAQLQLGLPVRPRLPYRLRRGVLRSAQISHDARRDAPSPRSAGRAKSSWTATPTTSSTASFEPLLADSCANWRSRDYRSKSWRTAWETGWCWRRFPVSRADAKP